VRDEDRVIDRVVEELKQAVRIDPALDARVMAAVARAPALGRGTGIAVLADWLLRTRTVAVSPLRVLAAAAVLALAVLAGRAWLRPTGRPETVATTAVPALQTADTRAVQFVVLVPHAASVALVGDFNDWSAAATPMTPAAGAGLWSVTVPLAPGRYRYSFLVDGTRWVPDPEAPKAVEDDFGRPNSVVTVGGT
jgi:hypothetical protein